MKILTKRILLATLTFCMVICSVLFTMSLTAFADGTANSVTFDTANFVMKEGASVRVGSNEAGTEFDYTKNGIRFMAKMSISEYEAIKDDNTITYGVLIAPKDYHDANPLNEANVFGENSVYSFDDSKTKIANITTKTLAPIDEDEDGTTDYYGYNASMVNVKTDNVTRQFVAVSYMMQSTEILVDGEPTGGVKNVYRFCNDNISSRSMSYVAQKAVEKAEEGSTPEWLVPALQASYITGKTTTVSLVCEKYYGEDVAATVNESITLELGTNVSSAEITQLLVDEGIVDESFALSNGDSIDGKKVYADGATGTLTLKYNAVESDETDYSKIKGYYQTEDGYEVKVNADKTVEIDGAQGVAYTLYKDGTLKTTVSNKTTFGSYDLAKKTLSVSVDSSVLNYAEVLELDSSVYGAVEGFYDYNGTLIQLNDDGTMVYDYSGTAQKGVYVLAYNEADGKFYIVINAGDVIITKQVVEADSVYSISDFTAVEFASEAQYTAIAEYYTDQTTNCIYKFNTDGTIVNNGANVGSFTYLSNGDIYANIDNVSLSGTFVKKQNAVYTKNVIELTNEEQTVSYVLSHTATVNYNVYDVFADEDGVIYYGDVKGEGTGGYGRLYLYNIKTDMTALATDVGLDGETKWYQCKYKLSIWGFVGNNSNPYAYRLEPTTYKDGVCVGGNIYFYYSASHGTKSSTFGIDDDGKLWVNVNYTPNGDSTTYCVQYAKEEELSISSSVESIYDIFATTEGVKYGEGNKYVKLFSTKTSMTISDSSYDWYTAEWSEGGVTHSTSKICYRLAPITDDGLFGRIYFYNGYNSTGTMYYGIVNGARYVDARTWDPNADAYKKLRVAYADNFDNVASTVDAHIADMKGKIYENAGAGAESVTFDVYADIAGTYKSKTHYGSTDSVWYNLGFTLNADGTTSMSVGEAYTGTYELIPYTDTFGKLNITPGYASNGNYDSTGTFWGYYSKINGEYVMRMMWSPSGVRYWHFIDFSKSGSTFSSWDIFDAVVGTEANAVYTDGNATLELALIGNNYNSSNPAGSKFVFTSGETVVNGTYDFVATSTTAGKIFLDFYATPGYKNSYNQEIEKIRYVIGEYALIDGQYVISFNYNGVDYVMNVSGSTDADVVVRNVISGTYAGASTTLTVDGNSTVNATSLYTGTVNIGDVTAEFVIEDDRIVLTYQDANYNDIIVVKAR